MEKMYQNYRRFRSVNPLVLLLSLIFGIFLLFWVIKNLIFKVLYIIAPFLFIIALLFNYKVVIGFGHWIWSTLRSNPLYGLIVIALTVLFYPIVGVYLAYKAYHLRGKKDVGGNQSKTGDYITYTEVEEDFLDISDVQEEGKNSKDQYEDLL